jgi:outer membrane protein TolC
MIFPNTLWLFAALVSLGIGQTESPTAARQAAQDGIAAPAAAGQPEPTGDADLTAAASATALAIPVGRMRWHLPDPDAERDAALEKRREAAEANDRTTVRRIDRTIELVDQTKRPERLLLSLEDVLRRTLENNYAIEVARFNPAVEATRVVEAEAAFDAVFFTDVQKQNIDRPSGSQLQSTDLDTFSLGSGVRKQLMTGTQLQGTFSLGRTKTNLAFQELNPEYASNFILDVRQPLLRNFGIDFNRSVIVLRQNDRRSSYYAFRRQVRDRLREAEELYWRLVQARRDVVITARLLAEFEQILEYLDARKDFDIIPVQLNSTRASLEQSRADFVVRVANVYDAEDRLIAVMNASDVHLADQMEIVPTDVPEYGRIVVDRLSEVQTALDHRPEIVEQRLAVASAKIGVGQARNAELPRLDLTFREAIDGLGSNFDDAFDQATTSNFIEYAIGVEFELPIGNRGPRAATKRARLVYAQAVAAMRQVFEQVILDVNLAVRRLSTTYDAIGPSFESAEAREREVDSIVARAERKDFLVLNNELSARQSLASARRGMLTALIEYNIAVVIPNEP